MKYKIKFIDIPGNCLKQESIDLPDEAIPLNIEVRLLLDNKIDLPFHIWINKSIDDIRNCDLYTRIYYLIKVK